MIYSVLAVIVTFCLLVFVHELGHFIVAKMVGMKVEEFALGMGPKIFGKKVGETEYTLRAIPIGGYNKIAGMDPLKPCEPGDFYSFSPWKRIPVLLAGAFMNIVLAFAIFIGVFCLFGAPTSSNIIGDLQQKSVAVTSGMQAGDKIVSIDGVAVNGWNESFSKKIFSSSTLDIVVNRNDEMKNFHIVKEVNAPLGISFRMEYKPTTLGNAIVLGGKSTVEFTKLIGTSLANIFTKPEGVQVSGPIGIVQAINTQAQQGLQPLLIFMALFSINLGLFNLFPIPLLDGGYVVMHIYEIIVRRKLNKIETNVTQYVGLTFIALLFLFGTWQDISRLING